MKKIICLLVVTLFMLSTVSNAFASDKDTKFTNETVITEDNIYDVMKYLGLDESKVVKNPDNYMRADVTIGDLLNAIEEAKSFPKVFMDIELTDSDVYNNYESKNLKIENSSKAAQTVSRSSVMGTMTLYYTATGEININPNTGKKFWTRYLNSTVDPRSTGIGTYYQVERINSWVGYIEGIPTYNTTLVVKADFVVGFYVGVKGIGIHISDIPVTSTYRYLSSML